MFLSPPLKPRRGSAIAFLVLAGAVAAPASASAHAVLTAPKPRDNRDDHKDTNGGAPCGVARAASQPMNPAMAPGSPFTVTWTETVNHPGCFVIDFSASGDTGWQMLSTVAHKTTGNTPRMYSQMVTLPSAPCTACTLRLRQIMLGSEPAAGACPPATIPTNATYYTCANVVLGGADGGAPSDAGGTGTGGAGTGGAAAGTGGRAGTGGAAPGSGGASSSSGGATNPGSGGAVASSGGANNPGSGGAVASSGGATSSSGGATSSSGGATNPGTGGGAAGGPGGNQDPPPPPCACGIVTGRSLGQSALLFGTLLGMTLLRGRSRRRSNPQHNQ
jgi:hypothetical protein